MAVFLAQDEPDYANKYGEEALIECMRSKGYRLLRRERFHEPAQPRP